MRYTKALLIILVFFFSMIFFNQNMDVLTQSISLRFSLFFESWRSIPLPFYFLLLISLLVGSLITLFYFWADKMKSSKQLRECKSKLAGLEQEVNSLRNLPLEDTVYTGTDYSTSETDTAGKDETDQET